MAPNLEISETSFVRITYGAIVVIFTAIVGFTAWMTTMQSSASAMQDDITELESTNKELLKTLNSIDKRTVRIETLLKDK